MIRPAAIMSAQVCEALWEQRAGQGRQTCWMGTLHYQGVKKRMQTETVIELAAAWGLQKDQEHQQLTRQQFPVTVTAPRVSVGLCALSWHEWPDVYVCFHFICL
jgi:hypothetical protein